MGTIISSAGTIRCTNDPMTYPNDPADPTTQPADPTVPNYSVIPDAPTGHASAPDSPLHRLIQVTQQGLQSHQQRC